MCNHIIVLFVLAPEKMDYYENVQILISVATILPPPPPEANISEVMIDRIMTESAL